MDAAGKGSIWHPVTTKVVAAMSGKDVLNTWVILQAKALIMRAFSISSPLFFIVRRVVGYYKKSNFLSLFICQGD